MMNTLSNKLWGISKSLIAVTIFGLSFYNAQIQHVFITEIADPANEASAGRYVELFNAGSEDINLNTLGWELQRWTNANANATTSQNITLSGIIPANGFYIVGRSGFEGLYGFAPNQISSNGPVDSNGDDKIALVDAEGNILDIFGVPGEASTSASGTDFENGRAERVASVTVSSSLFIATEWNVVSGGVNAPGGFDPGVWVGQTPTLVGDWKLAPIAGALSVGNADGTQVYWSNSQGDVTARACMFDDKFKFDAGYVFKNDLGEETWLESWQGVEEGCGAPIAPHDGSNVAAWSHDETAGTITIVGLGSYLGLAKAYNGGELGSLDDVVPTERTYTIESFNGQELKLKLDVGGNVWTFSFVRASVEIPHIDITFNVDMSNVEVVSTDGIYVGGGTFFGGPNENLLTDAGNGVFTKTISVPANSSSHYTYLNGNCSNWSCKEQIAGQDCSDASNYNDRFVEWGEDDITINECFGLCGNGVCSDISPLETVNVTINLDMSNVTTISDEGVCIAGGGIFGDPGDNLLIDGNDDDIFSGTFELPANGSGNYTFLNGTTWWDQKENIVGQDCADANNFNDRYMTWGDEDFVINACFAVCGDGTCADLVDGPAISGIVFSGAFGGGSVQGNVYNVPATAEPWAGFANEDVSVYPFNFPAGGGINFKASVDPLVTPGAEVLVNFKFESVPNPVAIDPVFSTESVVISGTEMTDYYVPIPAQGSSSFSSFLLYVQTRDISVTINELEVFENDPSSPYAQAWKLEPIAGAMVVSSEENAGGSVWWSISQGDVNARACLFDDKFVMHPDGGFDNVMGEETWLENWQGVDEGCGAPVAPHDNSNTATWSYNPDQMAITLTGIGSYLGLAKAYNGGELGSVDDVVPVERTYKVLSFDGDRMALSIQVGDNYWRFLFIRDDYVNPLVDVTFAVDMSNEIVSESGVWLAGGEFGNTGLQLLDDDQDGVYNVTTQLNRGSTAYYKFRNRASTGGDDWGGFEHMVGNQTGCLGGQYNDRFVDVPVEGEDFMIPPVCYRACVPCEDFETIDITFNLDMSNHDGDVSEQLSVAGGAFFQYPGNNLFSDIDNDGIYTAVVNVESNFHSNFTYVNGGDWGGKENIEGQFCADRNNFNDRVLHWGDEDMEVNSCFAKCGDGKCDDIEPSGPSDSTAVIFSVSMIGFDWGLDENGDPNSPADVVYATGSFEGWSGWGVEMTRDSDDEPHIYKGSRMFHKNQATAEEYKFTLGGWDVTSGASLGDWCDWNPNDEYDNYGFSVGDQDVQELPTYVFGGGCQVYGEPEEVEFSNYTLTLSDAESYFGGFESNLPTLDIDGQGLVIRADFDMSNNTAGDYVGALGIFWDSNFNNLLDSTDFNLAEDFFWYLEESGENDMNDDPRNRDHDGDGERPDVIVLRDNGPMDSDDALGVFMMVIDDFDFLGVQGATFLFAQIDEFGNATNSLPVKPVSSSPLRFSGRANTQPQPAGGLFVSVEKITTITWDDGNSYEMDYDDIASGITSPNGEYNIGVSGLMVGDTVYTIVNQGINERIYPYWIDENGNGTEQLQFEITSESASYSNDIYAIVFNTVVQGFVLDPNGDPISGEVGLDFELITPEWSDGLSIENYSDIGEGGFYSIWAMDFGTQAEISVYSYDSYGPSLAFDLNFGMMPYDEVLDAYVLNFDITGVLQNTATISGELFYHDENGMFVPIPNHEVIVQALSMTNDFIGSAYSDENGVYSIEVPVPGVYLVQALNDFEGYTTHDLVHTVAFDSNSGGSEEILHFHFHPVMELIPVYGTVRTVEGFAIVNAEVGIVSSHDDIHDWHDGTLTNDNGFYSFAVPPGRYDIGASAEGFITAEFYDVEVMDSDIMEGVEVSFVLNPVEATTGSVEGVVSFVGQNFPVAPAYVEVESDNYFASTQVDENGFYSIDLIDGVYSLYVNAPGYDSYFDPEAFEIAGNIVVYDVELFEQGYAEAPHFISLHDIPNDQGRQMRAAWHAGMPGTWGHFTQFSIWRKVDNAPIDLWDYIESVPWHGMEAYAAVVPTLGDSSVHGVHTSTFMVTAHTSDFSTWFDSEPMSGHSVDNLHPQVPMNLSFSTAPGSVSLTWSGPFDEDFEYFNVYRQDLLTNEPAVIFTTIDSFFVDQEIEDIGSYEYWVTAVDISGLESDPSSIVSAVLSTDESMAMPTEFVLKQNYPNPFNPSTQIQYALPTEANVVISIFDITGRKIRTLVNEVQSAGHRSVMWNATNDIGRPVSAGMYIYSIQAGGFIQNRKMVLMK